MAKAKAKAKRAASRGVKSVKTKAKGKSGGKSAARSKSGALSKGGAKSKSASKRPIARKGAPKKTAAGRGSAKRRVANSRTSQRTRLPHVGERGSGKGTIGKSGEGLDGGVARREAGDPGAVGTRPTSARRPEPRKARAQLPGEKAIADTDQTFPLRPTRPAPGEREPMPPDALDQRRQIVGTDDPGDVDDASDFEDLDDQGADAP